MGQNSRGIVLCVLAQLMCSWVWMQTGLWHHKWMNLQLMALQKCSFKRETVEVTDRILHPYYLLSSNCKSHPALSEKTYFSMKFSFFFFFLWNPASSTDLVCKIFWEIIPTSTDFLWLWHHGVASAPFFPHTGIFGGCWQGREWEGGRFFSSHHSEQDPAGNSHFRGWRRIHEGGIFPKLWWGNALGVQRTSRSAGQEGAERKNADSGKVFLDGEVFNPAGRGWSAGKAQDVQGEWELSVFNLWHNGNSQSWEALDLFGSCEHTNPNTPNLLETKFSSSKNVGAEPQPHQIPSETLQILILFMHSLWSEIKNGNIPIWGLIQEEKEQSCCNSLLSALPLTLLLFTSSWEPW